MLFVGQVSIVGKERGFQGVFLRIVINRYSRRMLAKFHNSDARIFSDKKNGYLA